jgi:hypothetical protein
VVVTILVIDAIRIIVSGVIESSAAAERLPAAPSYSTPSGPAAMATTPGTAPAATAACNFSSKRAVMVTIAPCPGDPASSEPAGTGRAARLCTAR